MIHLKGTEENLTTANNISLASAVRIYNPTDTDSVITVAAASGTSNHAGSVTLPGNGTIIIAKQPTDTVASGTGTMKAVSVAYHY